MNGFLVAARARVDFLREKPTVDDANKSTDSHNLRAMGKGRDSSNSSCLAEEKVVS